MSKTRVSEAIAVFNPYVNETDDYLAEVCDEGPPEVHSWERLGIAEGKKDEWHTRRLYWRDTLYPAWSNKLTKTEPVNKEVKNFIKSFREFANPQLNIMAASPNATEDDEAMFNFKRTRKKPSKKVTQITQQCMLALANIMGGEILVSVRTLIDSKRASIFKGADSFQVAFKILNMGDAPPNSPNDGCEKDIITKAKNIVPTGPENRGKMLYVFVRWYLTKYPHLAGPWSNMGAIMIA